MTVEQATNLYINFLKEISRQNYSQDMMETACNLLLIVPKSQSFQTLEKFTEIAKKGLSEKDYHWEISQVIKEIMGY